MKQTKKSGTNDNIDFIDNDDKMLSTELDPEYEPEYEQKDKSIKKPGKTLLVKSYSAEINEELFQSLIGLQTKTTTKTNGTYFLTFDTIQNASNAFERLEKEINDCNIKYSYYRLFFTIDNMVDTTSYNDVKTKLMEHISTNTDSTVLYCKLYKKNKKYLGCGDLTIDSIEGLNKILTKENGLKEFKIDNLSVVFYKFNNKRIRPASSVIIPL